MKLLVISTCQEKLSELEFVKPITDILDKINFDYLILHYKNINEKIIDNYDKVIICGTALKDDYYIKELSYFDWLKNINKPVLGVCSGMQVIGLIYGSQLIKDFQIGFNKIDVIKNKKLIKTNIFFSESFSGYELHNFNVTLPKDFVAIAKSKNRLIAIKHKQKNIFGLIFHPEVRNKNIIENFLKKDFFEIS